MRQVARHATIGLSSYRPTYHVTPYQRPLLQRLTPLTWFVIVLTVIGVLGGMAVIVHRLGEANNGTELVADRLTGRRAADTTASQAPHATALPVAKAQQTGSSHAQAKQATRATVAVAPTTVPTPMPTAAPTLDPNRVPWADELALQPDGTLLAPKTVVDKAVADLSAYYTLQRDLNLADFLAQRDEILATYFSGPALDAMREQEAQRKQYAMNRGGQVTVQVRDFSPDGLTAKAGIMMRRWTSDVYDVASRRLREKGKVDPDTFAIVSIRFDRANSTWKFDAVEEVAELEP